MTPPFRHAPLQPARSWSARAALWLLAVCLLLSPALGRVHQVVHGGGAWLRTSVASAPERPGDQAPALAAGGAHAHGGVLEGLFHGHAGGDCAVLDQLLFGMALLPVPALATPPGAPPAPQSRPATGIGARPLCGFLARAPPAPAAG